MQSRLVIEQRFGDLAQEFGISDRHLRRVYKRNLASPHQTRPNPQAIAEPTHSLTTSNGMQAISSSWQPWRSYVMLHLWKWLEGGEVFGSALVVPPAVA